MAEQSPLPGSVTTATIPLDADTNAAIMAKLPALGNRLSGGPLARAEEAELDHDFGSGA